MNAGQETPYQIALREHSPLPNRSNVRFHYPLYDREGKMLGLGVQSSGEIIGHRAVYENNVFQNWVYFIVPISMNQNGHILYTTEIPQGNIVI